MNREVTAAAAGLAALAVLAGCSFGSGKTGDAGTAKVIIDGQDQHVQGLVACTTVDGVVSILIGGQSSGNSAQLTDTNPPEVKMVSLSNPGGNLAYLPGQGHAEATKNGDSYKITGTGNTLDIENPSNMAAKTFEIDVTCP